MKRIVASIGALALSLAVVGSVAAAPRTDIRNRADVTVDVESESNSGDNTQLNIGGIDASGRRNRRAQLKLDQFNGGETGMADAEAIVTTDVNNGCNTCSTGGGANRRRRYDIDNNATVDVEVDAEADSGDNRQLNVGGIQGAGGRRSNVQVMQTNELVTGDASAKADTWTVVNSSYSTSN